MKKLIAALLLMLLALPQFAAAENAPSVTITFDKDTVAVGEEITATYEVSGDDDYSEVYWDWYAETDDGMGHNIGYGSSEEMTGTCSALLKFGEEVYLSIWVEDKFGRTYCFESEKAKVTGDQSEPPVVQITLNDSRIEVGETITAAYEVTGNGNYVEVYWDWYAETDDGMGHNIGNGSSDEMTGKCSALPRFGESVYLTLWVEDENGRTYYFESETAAVIGDESTPPFIQIELDKDHISIGEPITATYTISGEGDYVEVYWDWYAETDDGMGHNIGSDWSTENHGKCSAIPRFGEGVYFTLWVREENGRGYYSESQMVTVSGIIGNYDIYTVIEGENTQISDGTNSLTFRADGAFEKYLGVQVDGKIVPQRYVTAWSGSTYVELSKEYLASLEEGEHELTIIFDDGVAVTTFSMDVLEEEAVVPDLPQTGDNSALGAWAMLLAAAAVLLAKMKHAGQMNG